MKHDGYAERSDRATLAAATTPSPRAITSRANTTLPASPERSRADADATAAVHAVGLRTELTLRLRAAGALRRGGSRSRRPAAPGAAAVAKVRPLILITARAGTRNRSAGKPDHGPPGSRSGRYAKPPTAIGPASDVSAVKTALNLRHTREAASSLSSPGSKSMTAPFASSSATPPAAATMSNARPNAATLTASGIGRS